ncbi:MAG: hypothetical protein ABR615_06855 [Pseudonocardiaceae bacterium]|nr:hypothetical protein [Actinomycetota bacterium]
MTTNNPLGIYLNDHLAGAHAGVEMARQLQDEIHKEPEAEVLGRLAEEIEEDLDTLGELVDTIGSTRHPIKQAAGWVAEKAHRLGVAETRTGSPHLTRLLQTESLSLGVEGKLCLWLALIEVAPSYPQLAAVDFRRLVDRAQDQRRRLEVVRLAAARRAFATAD